MGQWRVFSKKCDFKGIGERLGVDQVLVRIMRNRDLTDEDMMREFLFGNEGEQYNYFGLSDIEEAVDIIMDKIDANLPIRIIGDYDADGIMSTYILCKGLRLCNAETDCVIPHRIKDGYGISKALIDEAIADGIDTIITCDNGIAAAEAFEHAKAQGMTCIVTDHHEIPYEVIDGEKREIIPAVDAVVDPKRSDDMYPHKNICGAVVAYKLIECLFDAMGMEPELLDEFREMAGFATVCDVMELRGENRYLVKYALKSLKNSHNIGMKALIRACELEGKSITSFSIGFVLGPCINATGRLDSARLSLDLLMAENFEKALNIATELKELNETRKKLTEEGLERAQYIIEQEYEPGDRVLVVYLPQLHESLAGIVAGRIREKYYKPVFVVTNGQDGLKGSARSIPEYHIYDAMTEVKDVFCKYGGHAMAAGFSLNDGMLDKFRRDINEKCKLTEEDLTEKILIDVPMPMEYVTDKLIEQLELLEPFGNGNAKPVFAQKNVTFMTGSIMGRNRNMARFRVRTESGFVTEMVMFRGLERLRDTMDDKFGNGTYDAFMAGTNAQQITMSVIYYPSINEFRGTRSIQFVLNDFTM